MGGGLPHGGLAALAQEALTRSTDTNVRPADTPELPPLQAGEGLFILSLIAAYPWPYAEALAVARCENRNLDPSIISPTEDYGIFGINEVHAARVAGDLTRLLIAEVNVRVAFEIWSEQGWEPWKWSRGCHGY